MGEIKKEITELCEFIIWMFVHVWFPLRCLVFFSKFTILILLYLLHIVVHLKKEMPRCKSHRLLYTRCLQIFHNVGQRCLRNGPRGRKKSSSSRKTRVNKLLFLGIWRQGAFECEFAAPRLWISVFPLAASNPSPSSSTWVTSAGMFKFPFSFRNSCGDLNIFS